MISVLIPVFNFDVVALVKELSRQLNDLAINGEILVFDDCSTPDFRNNNRSIADFNFVVYKELERNYGRVSIRQLLASVAKFEWSLFIDSDSRVTHADFLKKYLLVLKEGKDVYIGGRTYPERPVECSKRLHWKYGLHRESVKGNKSAFHSNNFCIRKKLFESLNFPQFLWQYGHEDTWMGIQLEQMNKRIAYINNTVEHIQIEDDGIFLEKTQQALQNLLLLQTIINKRHLAKHVALYRNFRSLQQTGLIVLVDWFFRRFSKMIIKNLHSCNPSLFLFDIYRLYYLNRLSKQFNSGAAI